jgi:hypothetical protein
MEADIDVNQLSKTFNLTPKDETYLKVLYNSFDYQVEESFYREKLKAIEPKYVTNFQKQLKTLEKDGLLLIGYDPKKEQRIIKLPIEELSKVMERQGQSMRNKNVNAEIRVNSLNDIDLANIRNHIVHYLFKSKNKESLYTDVYNYVIQNGNYSLSVYQFNKLVEKFEMQNDILVNPHGIDRKKSIKLPEQPAQQEFKGMKTAASPRGPKASQNNNILNAFRKGDTPNADDKKETVEVSFTSHDAETIKDTLSDFGIKKSPKAWITEQIENILVTLIANKTIIFDATVLDPHTFKQYRFVKDEMFRKENVNLDCVLQKMITDYIEKAYTEHYTLVYLMNMIQLNPDNTGMLLRLKEVIDKTLDSKGAPQSPENQTAVNNRLV